MAILRVWFDTSPSGVILMRDPHLLGVASQEFHIPARLFEGAWFAYCLRSGVGDVGVEWGAGFPDGSSAIREHVVCPHDRETGRGRLVHTGTPEFEGTFVVDVRISDGRMWDPLQRFLQALGRGELRVGARRTVAGHVHPVEMKLFDDQGSPWPDGQPIPRGAVRCGPRTWFRKP